MRRYVALGLFVTLVGCHHDEASGPASASATATPTSAATGESSGEARHKKEPREKPSANEKEASACAPSSAPCSGEAEIEVGGRKRSYRFHLPKSSVAKPSLVIALHGHGGDAAGFEATTHIIKLANEDGFVAIVPNGVEKAWADGRGVSDASKANVDDVAFVSTLIDRGVSELGADPAKVLVAGFSNGSIMTQKIGCELADKVAAICSVSGPFPSSEAPTCAPKKPITVISFHGTKDPVVPFAGGEVKGAAGGNVLSAQATAARWAELDKCGATPASSNEPDADPKDGVTEKRATYSGCANGTKVVFFTIDGGEHKWPTGPEPERKENEGQCRDIDALQTAWTLAFGK